MVSYPSPARVQEGGVAVFADAHLGQAEGDGDDFLASVAEAAGRGFRTVVFLGDIFQYFIGDPKFETPLIRRVVGGFQDLAAAGVSLRYVEGNRDFFLEGSEYVRDFAFYGDVDGLAVGRGRYAFVHGDRINTNDVPYRFWRRLSKNAVSRGVMRAMPGPLARAIVARTEERLYRSNFRHKRVLPERFLGEEGERARRAGYDAVLVGHFHVDRVFESPLGVARVLPAWLEERRHVEIAPDGTLTLVEESTAGRAVPRRSG